MKTLKTTIAFFATVLILFSCKKQDLLVPSKPIVHVPKYNSAGLPEGLSYQQTDAGQIINANNMVVEGQDVTKSNPNWFNSTTWTSNESNVTIIPHIRYLDGHTSTIPSTLMYYVYRKDNAPQRKEDIKEFWVAFPHVGLNTPLKSGDVAELTGIGAQWCVGLVYVQNGWDESTKSLRPLDDPKSVMLFLDPNLNVQKQKQALVTNYNGVQTVFFEDELRIPSNPDNDNDFNELIVQLNMSTDFPFQSFPGQIVK